ncbi:hypothetical protein GOODEAATRI_007375, partial [Goodea atripinnis]
LCRFFSQGRHCNFGKRCRFLHVREDGEDHERKTAESPSQPDVTPTGSQDSGQHKGDKSPLTHNPTFGPASARRPCRYFHLGHCTMEDRCRFWHPPPFPPVDDSSVTVIHSKATPSHLPVSRPGGLQEVKLCDMTEDKAKEMRDTEIKQLKKRFPKDQLIIQESSDGKLTYYRATIEATDPDWAKHATNQLLGKVEMLFRPFRRWLDRSLERLFTEGARQVAVTETSDPASGSAADEDTCNMADKTQYEESEEEQPTQCDEGQLQEEDGSHLVENIKINDPRRGTEIKLIGLRLGENTATVIAQQITVCLQCNRCKVTADLTLSGRTACSAQCEKCNADINAVFRPCMIHHYSDVLGYLDLQNAIASDLVLQDCDLTLGCLSCSQEVPVERVFYGQTKEFNCENCHSKLSIMAESTRFQHIQPRSSNKTDSSAVSYKTIRDPAVQKGKPLPDKGTCKHYKQSHRWLRYRPCSDPYFILHISVRALRNTSPCVFPGFPAVVGHMPVMCATMRTRTTPWNSPPG